MSLFTDLHAAEGFVMGLIVLGAECILGMSMLECLKLRRQGTMVAGLVCLLSVFCSEAKDSRASQSSEKSNAPETPRSRYTQQVKEQVGKKWNHAFAEKANDEIFGILEVVFYVNKQGKVEDVSIVNDKDASPNVARYTLQAVQDAEIPPMTADVISGLSKQGRLKITYQTPVIKPRPMKLLVMKPPVLDQTNAFGASQAKELKEAKDAKARYTRQVLNQVEWKWHNNRKLRRNGVTYGSLQVAFYVSKKGRVEDVRIVNDKESNPILTEFTLQAIRDAEIPTMPADVIPLLPKKDQGFLKVEYNVLIY